MTDFSPPTNLTQLDIAFGNIDHLPKMDDIPEEYKGRNNKSAEFVTKWFFEGLTQEEADSMVIKKSINRHDRWA